MPHSLAIFLLPGAVDSWCAARPAGGAAQSPRSGRVGVGSSHQEAAIRRRCRGIRVFLYGSSKPRMPGTSLEQDDIKWNRHARACRGHPRLESRVESKPWMAGTSPAMTEVMSIQAD